MIKLLFLFTLLMVGCSPEEPEKYADGIVETKSYAPSQNGSGLTSSGKVVWTQTEAKWVVVIKINDETVVVVETTGPEWGRLKVGDKVKVGATNYRTRIAAKYE